MQEEIEQKTMTLSINATKFSGRVLKAAITKYLAHRSAKKHERQREKADVIPHGKQKVKELIGQNAGVANVDIKDEDLKGFERIARKYGVDYAVKRVKG
ncbi:MAG: PcfB family protein, partial [Oscillospiraceae bacterium]|nr:PcfB family protein [Oscillospiraceae bacterium]